MRQNMENRILVCVEGVDLTRLSGLEFYMRQGSRFFQYEPEVLSETRLSVTIPCKDALKLRGLPIQLQIAFTDESGRPAASEITVCSVKELLKEDGYDPA